MSDATSETAIGRKTSRNVRKAVYQCALLSRQGLLERLFARLFSGLVYAQIWEDPQVDIDAMALQENHRLVSIGSGGCNVLAYLAKKPSRIDVVDLNAAHIALIRLKLAAIEHLPAQSDLLRFFGRPGQDHNSEAYDQFIAPQLDAASRAYWEHRNWRGKRRIAQFNGNFYRSGLLGMFITAGHFVARMHGVDPKGIMNARCLREQRHFFDQQLSPLFDRPLIRWITRRKASLFGLGIPPAQYDELLSASADETIATVLRERLEKLACHFPLQDNYFAWQAFSRHYGKAGHASLPAYLEKSNYASIRDQTNAVSVHHRSFTELLKQKAAGSVDRFVLLDAQDWMNDIQLNELWTEISRTAAENARVIFRTAGRSSVIEGRLSASVRNQWDYRKEESLAHCRRDRSAIYGGFHLYVKNEK